MKLTASFLVLWLAIVFVNINLYGCGKKSDGPKDDPVVQVPPDEPIPDTPLPQDPPPVDPDPGPNPDPEPEPDPVPEPSEPPVPIPLDPAKTFKTHVEYFGSQATVARKAKYDRAQCVLKKVVALDKFKQQILSYSYNGGGFYDTRESNAEIWGHILAGNETLQPVKDNELDVEVEFYYAATSTVGYTYGNSKRIWVNTKFNDQYTPASVAANLMHEWLHKLGYKHAQSYSSSRDHSVPYAIGSMVRSLGKQFEPACP